MVEMTTLIAAIYRVYRTRAKLGTEDTSPGITSRFEVFYDETMPRMKVCSHLLAKSSWKMTLPIGTCVFDRFPKARLQV